MIRTAIIGYGVSGTAFHAPLIRCTDGLELVAVTTSRPEKAPAGVAVLSPEEAIAGPDIDLVVIAAPNTSHFPLADAALRAGKHVVVDKPLAVSVAEADRLIGTARAQCRTLTVFHNRRWDGDFLTVQKVLASERLGEVMLYEAHWDRFRPAIKQGWREVPADGAGLLFDLGSHLVDQALHLFGKPEAISADVAIQRQGACVDDYFRLTLHYGRMRALLSASTLVADPRPRFALHGSGGSFVKYGLDPQEMALKGGAGPLDAGFGLDEEGFYGRLTSGDGASEIVATQPGRYLAFYEGVTAAIGGEAPPPVDPADAREGLAIIELARRSAAEGRTLSFG